MTMQSCKTCKYWGLEIDKAELNYGLSYVVFRCTFPINEIKLPKSFGFSSGVKGVSLSLMSSSDGQDCETYEKREQVRK